MQRRAYENTKPRNGSTPPAETLGKPKLLVYLKLLGIHTLW